MIQWFKKLFVPEKPPVSTLPERIYTRPPPLPRYRIEAAITHAGTPGYELGELTTEYATYYPHTYYKTIAFNEHRDVLERAIAHLES